MTKHIHMMGVGGSGMSGVAMLASKMGYEVTGCDLEDQTAYAANIFKGHSPDHLKDADLLVVSPAVFFQNPDNAELVEAQKRKIVLTWQEFLGKYLANGKKVICVAGTHGKSTTTAMVGKLLIDTGFDPTVIVGATVPEWNGNARFGKGEYLVIEADEFNNNFLNYHPDIIILNNIEFDHPDFFKNEDEVRESFSKFIGKLVGEKILITEKDSPLKKFNLKVFGEHNQKNANMVYVLGQKLGIGEKIIIKSLEGFAGIGRRMELIADKNGIKVYDDYAHHPTAIKTTIEGLRNKFPQSKIWVIDEPHGFARTQALLSKYKGAFDTADKVIIGPIFKARDSETFGMTPEVVARASGNKNAVGIDSFEKIKKILLEEIKSGDIVLVMGAGKSYLWARELAGINEINNKIKENISLKELTTFKIGGHARYYAEVENEKDIMEVSKFTKENNLKIFILGGGSDILINDRGFDGIVIKYVGNNLSQVGNIVTAEAGVIWDELVKYSVKNKLQGIECMSGIPGMVGAAPIQNLGAYGQEIKDTLSGLKAFEFESGMFLEFSDKDCQFGYRESFFKKPENYQKYLITAVSFKLNKNGSSKVEYESLSNYLKEKNIIKPSLKEIREAALSLRREKLENPKEFGNAGSFFKNPVVDKEIPGIPSYPFGKKYKLFAGWLIDKAGWKGKTFGGAGVSSKNALFIINKTGKASSFDVLKLSEMIIADVYKKFGVKLEREVQLINFR